MKFFKISMTLILIVVCIIYLKNFILFITYKHGNHFFEKSSSDQNEWVREIEVFPELMDAKMIERYKFSKLGFGYYYFTSFGKKINGEFARTYSFTALLPYDADSAKHYESSIWVDSVYITFFPSVGSLYADTVFSKYSINMGKLFVDSRRFKFKYSDVPIWEEAYSSKPKFIGHI